eukprot:TRINITY_DN8543_c0_g2_i1.p1 TRINITY_DN8543_c0_g2~~TRINITY_DN8543_c0_g2_i1.p1  ORF type:complete len:244 (+),score=59.72 TRINITY_DN8543_c0_g2_i1:27-734(+)
MGSGNSAPVKEVVADASVDDLKQACGLLTEEQRLKLNSAIATLAKTVVAQGIDATVDEPMISDEAKPEEAFRAETPSTAAPMTPKTELAGEEFGETSPESQPLDAIKEDAVALEVQASAVADVPMPQLETACDETTQAASEKLGSEQPSPVQATHGLSDDLPPENIQRAAFDSIDKNNSGYIEPDEFAAVLKEMKVALTDEEIQLAFEAADLNADNKLDFLEYAAFLQRAFDSVA